MELSTTEAIFEVRIVGCTNVGGREWCVGTRIYVRVGKVLFYPVYSKARWAGLCLLQSRKKRFIEIF